MSKPEQRQSRPLLLLRAARSKHLPVLLALVAAVTIVEWPYLFGSAYAVFFDISDSYRQFLPMYMRWARLPGVDALPAGYDFTAALGQPYDSIGLYSLLLSAFGQERVPMMMGVLQSTLMVVSGLFIYAYILRLGHSTKVACMIALSYTLCGAMVIRAVLPSYIIEYLCAAVLLYGLEEALSDRAYWLVPLALFLMFTSVDAARALLYILLSIAYAAFRCLLCDKKHWLRAVGKVTLLSLLGALMAAVYVGASFIDNSSSERFKTGIEKGLGPIFNLTILRRVLYRLFSPELLGDYYTLSGGLGHFSGPLFYIGILNVLILPQVFIGARPKQRLLYGLCCAAIALYWCCPALRVLMNGFNVDTFKQSSFWICILMLFMCASAWARYFKQEAFSVRTLIITALCCLAILLTVPLGDEIAYRKDMLIASIIILCIDCAVLLLCRRRGTRLMRALPVAVLCAELIFNAAVTVGDRDALQRKDIDETYIRSGIGEAISSLARGENDYFRVTNNDSRVDETRCDSWANDYLSTSSYLGGAGLSRSYIDLCAFVTDDALTAVPTIKYAGNDLSSMRAMRALLGVRYTFYGKRNTPQAPALQYGQTLTDNPDWWIIEDEYALPLAYTYDSVISEADAKRLSATERRELLTQSAVVADNSPLLSAPLSAADDLYWKLSEQLDAQSIPFEVTVPYGKERMLELRLDEPCPTEYLLLRVNASGRMAVNSSNVWNVEWAGADGSFSAERSFVYSDMCSGTDELLLELPARGAQTVRLTSEDRNTRQADIVGVSAVQRDFFAPFEQNIKARAEDGAEIKQLSTNRIEVHVSAAKPRLLCLPFTYINGWSVQVDGADAPLHKINLGMMGVLLTEGEHDLCLTFKKPYQAELLILSAVGVGCWLLLIIWECLRRRRRNDTRRTGANA